MVDINNCKNIHFIGIGGIGMSSLARFFVQEKKTVTGSDASTSIVIEGLQNLGIEISLEQGEQNIQSDTDIFVYTEAIADDNEELIAARATGKPVINYFQALGLVANPYYLIVVAGTHGKTTTTAMLTDIFEAAEKDPTAIIGSLRAKTKSNYRAGKSKYAIVEACEYKRDFLTLTPDVLVITNIEHEHVDYYSTLEDTQSAFRELISNVHETGVVIANPHDPTVAPVLQDCPVSVVDYTKYLDLDLQLYAPGIHNLQNAAAARAVAEHEQISTTTSCTALEEFTGTWRRFEFKGEVNNSPVYDDYAHHPTAIIMTLKGVREMFPKKKIIAVFQPHTFSRTKGLFEAFARSFQFADEVIIAPIYGAREENTSAVSSRELAVKALEFNKNVQYIDSFDKIESAIRTITNDKSLVIVMGAGPITEVANNLVVKNK